MEWAELSSRIARADKPRVLVAAVSAGALSDVEFRVGLEDAWTTCEWPGRAAERGVWVELCFVFIAPFGDGYHRVLSWDTSLRPDDDEAQDFNRLTLMVATILGEDVGVYDPRWISRFSSHERVATEYRCHRAFLLGDAAHVHSPAGGLGMNLGLQDAVNLGWKLGAVLHRAAPAALLDSYEREIQPLGYRAVKDSGQLIREATCRSGISASIKDTLLAGAARIRPVKDLIERGLGQSISGTNSVMLSPSRRRFALDRHIGTFASELMSNQEVLAGLRNYKHVLVAPRGYSLPTNPELHRSSVRVEIDHGFRGDSPRLLRPDGYIDDWRP